MQLKKLFILIFTSVLVSGCNSETSKKSKTVEEQLENMEEAQWYQPEDPTPKHQCPCCDYVTLPERANYLICPICFWEDDGLDIDKPDEHSGPNHISIREGRENFLKYGACDSNMVKNVIPKIERVKFKFIKRELK